MTFKIREITDLVPEEGLNDSNKPKSLEHILAESEQKIIDIEVIREKISEELTTFGRYKHGSFPFPEKTGKLQNADSPLGRETSPNVYEETSGTEKAKIEVERGNTKKPGLISSTNPPSRSLKSSPSKFKPSLSNSTHPDDR